MQLRKFTEMIPPDPAHRRGGKDRKRREWGEAMRMESMGRRVKRESGREEKIGEI